MTVQCPDGTIVGSDMICPPVQCPDGTIVGGDMTCPPVQCPDGTIVGSDMICPPVQCPDGTIVGSDMTCPPTGSGIIALPSTYQFVGSSNFRLQPGETINRGILQFLCEGDQSCEVFLDAANDVASFTGGVVSATEIPAPLIGSNFTLAPGEHRLVRLPESNLLHMVICGHPDEACEIRDFQFDHTKANWVWLGTNDGHLLVSDDETGFYLAEGEEITVTYPNGRMLTFGCNNAEGCGVRRTYLDAQGNPAWVRGVVDDDADGREVTPWGSPVVVAQDGVRIAPPVGPDPGAGTGVTPPVNTAQFDFPQELPEIAVNHWELSDSYIGIDGQRLESVCPGVGSIGDLCSVGGITFRIFDVLNRAHRYGIEVRAYANAHVYGYLFFGPDLLRKLELTLKSQLTEEEREELRFGLIGLWGQHSAFGTLSLPHSIIDPTSEMTTAHQYAFGHLHYGFPEPLANESGTATWRGPWNGEFGPWDMASGTLDYLSDTRPFGGLWGESNVVYDFAGRDVDVTLSVLDSTGHIAGNLDKEVEYPGNPTISWEDIPQNHDGSFFLQGNHEENTPLELGGSGYIDGDFYGRNAEEVAGIFERVTGGYHLQGTFGGKRVVE